MTRIQSLCCAGLVALLSAACAGAGGTDPAGRVPAGALPVAPGAAVPDTAALDAVIADFAARLAADVAADSVGSIAAAVVADGRVVWSDAFGVADAATGEPALPGTIYRIGSISKTVTAVVLMRLVEAGVVELDGPVAAHVPEIAGLAARRAGSSPITFRQLASHTAGLEREPSSSLAARGRAYRWDRKVVASIPLTEVRSRPGEVYLYSNIGYGILGLGLERAARRPFEELVEEYVLEPLGMSSSLFHVSGSRRARLAAGYVNVLDGTVDPRMPRAEHRGRGYKIPNEGLYSTTGDLARLLLMLSGDPAHALLDAEARGAMLADQTAGDGRAGYGLGLQLTRIGGTLLAGHSGTVAGYASYLVFDPASGVGAVLLRNYNQGRTNLAAEGQRVVLDLAGVAAARQAGQTVGVPHEKDDNDP